MLTNATGDQLNDALKSHVASGICRVILGIHSSGGSVDAFHKLERSFRRFANRCTVHAVTTHAESAAAYLLLSAHRTFAMPHARLALHGTRWKPERPSTLGMEQALAIALKLDRENRRAATALGRRVAMRMAFRILCLKRECRANNLGVAATPTNLIEWYVNQVTARLSSRTAQGLLADAFERYKDIPEHVRCDPTSAPTTAQEEFALFCDILGNTRSDKTANSQLKPFAAMDFALDYILTRHIRKFGMETDQRPIIKVIAQQLSYGELEHLPYGMGNVLNSLHDTIRCATALRYFAIIFCHRLLHGENNLTASDAFWMGLLDNIVDDNPALSDFFAEALAAS